MQHMTNESLAFLRAQEQLLIRRSTMQLAEAHVRATAVESGVEDGIYGGEIGVAMPFKNNHNNNESTTNTGAIEHIDPFTGVKTILPPDMTVSGQVSRKQSFMPVHARGLSTGGFAQAGTGGKGPGREIPPGSVSMVELPRLGAPTKQVVEPPVKTKKKRKHWWKVWRLV
jgi:hypothetical protein